MMWNEKESQEKGRVLYILTDILYDGKEQTVVHAFRRWDGQ